ncbi:MAG TPA: toll/interleukin-1 receptor domain-containing protein, partial [Sphingobium sp.]
MAKAFISYCRRSGGVVKTLVDDLDALGYNVWFDQELSGGQAWWTEILAKIRECDLFVFALDP